jgi:DNA-binding phage protein
MSNIKLDVLDIVDLQSMPMMTRDQLAELLGTVNVEVVAREAKVSTKTIYRLRHKQNAPTLDTVQSLLDAIKRLGKKASA